MMQDRIEELSEELAKRYWEFLGALDDYEEKPCREMRERIKSARSAHQEAQRKVRIARRAEVSAPTEAVAKEEGTWSSIQNATSSS